jgi:DNA repair exonuclease SbcCD ATPase subunit
MSLEDTEIKIGGTSFKGIYVAIVLSLATSLGGVFWSASSLYSRLEAVEARSIPNVQPMREELELIKQQLQDNEISDLSAKLAALGTNLATIMDQQEKLLELKSELSTLSKEIEAMKGTVAAAEVITKDNEDIAERIQILTKEAEDLWSAVQYLSNPYR